MSWYKRIPRRHLPAKHLPHHRYSPASELALEKAKESCQTVVEQKPAKKNKLSQ